MRRTGIGGAGSGSFRFEDPRQGEIFERLSRLVGPGPASFYKDARRHIDAEYPMDTVTHQVGHCVRELEGAMRDVLRPAVGARRETTSCTATEDSSYEGEAKARGTRRTLRIRSSPCTRAPKH